MADREWLTAFDQGRHCRVPLLPMLRPPPRRQIPRLVKLGESHLLNIHAPGFRPVLVATGRCKAAPHVHQNIILQYLVTVVRLLS